MNVIPLKTTGSTHLYGASAGDVQRVRILERVGTPSPPGAIVIVDFRGIESVTASFLKACLLWLMEAGARSERGTEQLEEGGPPPLNIFPMVAHLNDEVRSELRELLQSRNRCCVEAKDFSSHSVKRGVLLGPLDRVLEDTVNLLSAMRKPVSALGLDEMGKDPRVKATGWNNRLAALHQHRLVQRRKEGREWMYQLIAEEVRRG